jgi:hypothetical protein
MRIIAVVAVKGVETMQSRESLCRQPTSHYHGESGYQQGQQEQILNAGSHWWFLY